MKTTNVPANHRISYAYDGVGNQRWMDVQDSGRTTYAYRQDRQILNLRPPSGGLFTWLYDNAGRNRSQLNPNAR